MVTAEHVATMELAGVQIQDKDRPTDSPSCGHHQSHDVLKDNRNGF